MDEHTKEVVANLLCYLVDNHENELLSEDALQQIGVKFLADEQYRVVINHTDPVQQETAICLKYRQRAKDSETALALAEKKLARAEKLNTVMYEAIKAALRIPELWCPVCVPTAENEGEHQALSIMFNNFNEAIILADKRLEALLKPGTNLPYCIHQLSGSPVKCSDPDNVRHNMFCDKHCTTPTGERSDV